MRALAERREGPSWRTLALLFALTSVAEAFGFGHFTAFGPLYLAQLGVAPEDVPRWTGVLAAGHFFLGLPFVPLWGVWADRYSRKWIIVRSAIGQAIVFALAALAQNPWQLLGARLLSGFLFGNTGVMFAVLSSMAPRARLAFAIATVQTGSTLGQTIGPLFGGVLVPWIGIPGLLAFDSAFSLLTAVLLVVIFKERREGPRETRSTVALLRALPAALRAGPLVLPLYGVQCLVLLGERMSTPFVPLLVAQLASPAETPLVIGLVMTCFGLASATFTLIWGRLGDRLGRLRVLQVTILLSAAALAAQALAPTWPALLAARATQGIFQGATAPLIVALVATNTPEKVRATVLNMTMFPMYLATITGGALGAILGSIGVRVALGGGACATVAADAALAVLRARGRLAAPVVTRREG